MIRTNGQQSNKLNLIIVEEEGNDIGEKNKPKIFRRFKTFAALRINKVLEDLGGSDNCPVQYY